MQFENEQQEKEFDRYAAEFLLKKRNPKPEHMALVLVRAYENLAGAPPSISAFERAWLELYKEKSVPLVMEQLNVPAAEPAKTLTVEEYRSIPANQIARDYLNNKGGWFRGAVDELVRLKKI